MGIRSSLRWLVLAWAGFFGLPILRPAARGPQFTAAWRPSAGAPRGLRYAGSPACIQCHRLEAGELRTPMGLASVPAAQSYILRVHPDLHWRSHGWSYRILRRQGREIYSVSRSPADASPARHVTFTWAFGNGRVGQTFVFQLHDRWYESRISYFSRLHGLAFTIGDRPRAARTVPLRALGRRMYSIEVIRCIGCHTTGALRASGFAPGRARPGVGCEDCHGPGSSHIAAMRAGRFSQPAIFNPARLSSSAQIRFCGDCHRTLGMVLRGGFTGRITARFQPYRLALSQCWLARPNDARLSCLACHNPHQPLLTRGRGYDAACLACHTVHPRGPAHKQRAQACPVARTDCVHCHMPRIQVPAAHYSFVDHDIRIVRRNVAFPE